MSKPKKPKAASYTPAPRVNDPELLHRYELALKVLTGQMSVKAAAKQAGLSRVRFQTLMHRAQTQLLSELAQKPAGRPAKAENLRELETRNRRLEVLFVLPVPFNVWPFARRRRGKGELRAIS